MTRILPIIVLMAGFAFGCSSLNSRSVGSLALRRTGTHGVYAPDGRLLQKTVWRDGKLVAAWQYEQRWELALEVIKAVHQGERDYPPPRWVQTVDSGRGRLHTFDERGFFIGF